MSVTINGKGLAIEDVVAIARDGEKVELHPDAVGRMTACRAMVERKIGEGQVMYGINTGIGELSEVRLSDDEIKKFQKYLIYNHSAGYGDPAPIEHVRAGMASRLNVISNGNSGNRPIIAETIASMLNEGVTPVVCEKGSVCACGDLAPMSQVALVVMGEGEAFLKGERLPGREAMDRAGIEPVELKARDGLAMINGSNLTAGMAALLIYDAERWLKQAEIAASMTLEALLANMSPFDDRLHTMRGFQGSIISARNLRRCMEGGDVAEGRIDMKVQDAYSMRSTPQVIGAARDALRWARSQIEIELNGVGDNPVFIPEDDIHISGANFQGSPIAVPIDTVASCITMVSVLSERRLNRLLHPALSVGLPPFLTKGAGMFSGLMLSQYTADMLIVEQRILSTPASIQSIPAAGDQEDFVSMGMNCVLKARQILDNANAVLGIELIAGAQAIDFRDTSTGKGTRIAYDAVRKVVEHLDVDRPLHIDHNNMAKAVKDCEVLKAVEAEIGELEMY